MSIGGDDVAVGGSYGEAVVAAMVVIGGATGDGWVAMVGGNHWG